MTSPTNVVDRARTTAAGFGVDHMLDWQERAVLAAAEGRDVVVLAPTGSGKSLVYQVAGLLAPGWTLVVSPLLALQRDQLDHLAEVELDGRSVRAERLEGSLSDARRSELLDAVGRCEVDFVYLAPEQLARDDVRAALRDCPPSLVAIDEAHCVSEWGHDFRPDYLRVGEALADLDAAVLATTATAAPPVLEAVVEALRMDDPERVYADPERDNLRLSVEQTPDEERRDARVVELASRDGAGLVYVRTRKEAERLAEAIAEARGEEGGQVEAYHAGLGTKRREAAQQAFMAGEVGVLVATSAFGMGVDKPDVRWVVHAGAPASLDEYVQELGRAGRDGEPADVVLVHRTEDLALGRFFSAGVPKGRTVSRVLRARADVGDDPAAVADASGVGRPTAARVLNLLTSADPEAAGGDEVEAVREVARRRRRFEQSRVDMVREYAATDRCRTQFLLGYLGHDTEPCGQCDTCAAGAADRTVDRTVDHVERERVEHPTFGPGLVVDGDEEQVTVLFDDGGYKSLDRGIVEERGLLDTA